MVSTTAAGYLCYMCKSIFSSSVISSTLRQCVVSTYIKKGFPLLTSMFQDIVDSRDIKSDSVSVIIDLVGQL